MSDEFKVVFALPRLRSAITLMVASILVFHFAFPAFALAAPFYVRALSGQLVSARAASVSAEQDSEGDKPVPSEVTSAGDADPTSDINQNDSVGVSSGVSGVASSDDDKTNTGGSDSSYEDTDDGLVSESTGADGSHTSSEMTDLDADSVDESHDVSSDEAEDSEAPSDPVDAQALASQHADDIVDGSYAISSSLRAASVFDAKSGGQTAGTKVQLYSSNKTDAQVWRIEHDGDYVVISNAASGLAIDIKGGKASSKAALQLNTKSQAASQRWIAVKGADGSYKFVSALDQNMVIDLAGAKTANGAAIQVYADNGTKAQSWTLSPAQTQRESLDTLAEQHRADLPDGEYVISPSKSSDVGLSDGSPVKLANVSYRDAIVWRVTHDDDGYVVFTNLSSKRVLDVQSAETSNSTKVQTHASNGTYAQKWIAELQDDGSYRFISALKQSMVLDAKSGSVKNGTSIQINSDSGTAAQRWNAAVKQEMVNDLDALADENRDVLADGTYAIVAGGDLSRRMAVDVASGSKADKANVQLYASNGTDAQRWTVSHDDKGYVTFTSVSSGKVLDVASGYAADGTNVQQYTGNDSLAQKWIVLKDAEGTYQIMSALWPERALEGASNALTNKTNIRLGAVDGSAAQRFAFFSTSAAVEPCDEMLPSGGYYRLRVNTAANCVVDMPSASRDNGKNPQLYASNDTLAQLYSFKYVNGYYQIICAASGKALDIYEGDVVPGVVVQQWTSGSNNNNQLFSAVKNEDGSYTFINKGTGLALGFDGTSSGAKLKAFSPDGSDAQKFTFEEQKTLIKEGVYTISSAANSKLALDVAAGSGADDANVQVCNSNSSFAQKWKIELVAGEDNTYTIESLASGMLLSVTSGGDIRQSPRSDAETQKWIVELRDGYYVFENVANNGYVIGIKGSSAISGADVRQLAKSDSKLQQFKLSSASADVPNGIYYIRVAGASDRVLDVNGGSYSSGANVQLYTKNGTGAQKWKLTRNSDGTYTILNAQSELALDVKSGSAKAGANVQQYASNNTKAQKWYITYENGGYKIVSALSSSLSLGTKGDSISSKANVELVAYSGGKAQQFTFLSTTYTPVYHGFQNPKGYYQVSNLSVTIKNQGKNKFGYRSPSRIPIDATRQECINAMVTRAMDYLGTNYMWDYSCAPGVGVDCAGLVMQALYATGMDLSPMNPWDHYYSGLNGGWHSQYANYMWEHGKFQKLSISKRQRGDIISWSGHVAIYLGNDQIIEAPARGMKVRITSLWNNKSKPRGVLRPYIAS